MLNNKGSQQGYKINIYKITQAKPNFIRIDNIELQINKKKLITTLYKDVNNMDKTKHNDKSNLFLNHNFYIKLQLA